MSLATAQATHDSATPTDPPHQELLEDVQGMIEHKLFSKSTQRVPGLRIDDCLGVQVEVLDSLGYRLQIKFDPFTATTFGVNADEHVDDFLAKLRRFMCLCAS